MKKILVTSLILGLLSFGLMAGHHEGDAAEKAYKKGEKKAEMACCSADHKAEKKAEKKAGKSCCAGGDAVAKADGEGKAKGKACCAAKS